MKILSLGVLRSRLVGELGVPVPVECQVRLRRVRTGEEGTEAADALLSEAVGAPVRVDYEVSLRPLGLQFRTDAADRFFSTQALPETGDAVPLAVLDCLLKQAGVSVPGARDVLVIGHAGDGDSSPAACDWRTAKSLARALGARLVGSESRSVPLRESAGLVFGRDCRRHVLQALQIPLVTNSPRLTG